VRQIKLLQAKSLSEMSGLREKWRHVANEMINHPKSDCYFCSRMRSFMQLDNSLYTIGLSQASAHPVPTAEGFIPRNVVCHAGLAFRVSSLGSRGLSHFSLTSGIFSHDSFDPLPLLSPRSYTFRRTSLRSVPAIPVSQVYLPSFIY
jgi:hypothetical protein